MSAAPRGLLGSSVAAILSQLWRFVLVFATHVVLRRLVDPADWGLWYWCEPFFLVLGGVRDLGLPTHMMRLDPRPYRSLLKVELVMGTALGALVVLGAPLLSHAYGNSPADLEHLPLVSAGTYVNGSARALMDMPNVRAVRWRTRAPAPSL